MQWMKKLCLYGLALAIIGLAGCGGGGDGGSEGADLKPPSVNTSLTGALFTLPIQNGIVEIYELQNSQRVLLGTTVTDEKGAFTFATENKGPFIAKYRTQSGKMIGSAKAFEADDFETFVADLNSPVLLNPFGVIASKMAGDNPTPENYRQALDWILSVAEMASAKCGYPNVQSVNISKNQWTAESEVALIALAIALQQDISAEDIHKGVWIKSAIANLANKQGQNPAEVVNMISDAHKIIIEKTITDSLNIVNNTIKEPVITDDLKTSQKEPNNSEQLYIFALDSNLLEKKLYKYILIPKNKINIDTYYLNNVYGDIEFYVTGVSNENAMLFESEETYASYLLRDPAKSKEDAEAILGEYGFVGTNSINKITLFIYGSEDNINASYLPLKNTTGFTELSSRKTAKNFTLRINIAQYSSLAFRVDVVGLCNNLKDFSRSFYVQANSLKLSAQDRLDDVRYLIRFIKEDSSSSGSDSKPEESNQQCTTLKNRYNQYTAEGKNFTRQADLIKKTNPLAASGLYAAASQSHQQALQVLTLAQSYQCKW